jgi:hypothetical protein
MSFKQIPLILAASLLLASTGIHAQQPTPESVDKLLAATQSEKVLDALFANMDQMMRQSMVMAARKEKLTAEQQRLLDVLPGKFVKVMREEMSWDKLQPMYAQIYRENFTQEDIDGLIAFYESPTGKVFVQKMPGVVQKTAVMMQSRMAPIMQKMQAAVMEAVVEAKKTGP